MKKQIIICIAAAAAVLLIAGALGVYFFAQQQAEMNRLTYGLANEKLDNAALREELDRLNYRLSELQEENDRLTRESSRSGEEGREQNPGGSGPVAYITIDDGPSKNTLEILDLLDDYNIPATFFVTGNNYSGESGIYRRIAAAGHTLANHTYSHNFEQIYRSVDDFISDFIRLEQFLMRETGVKTDIMRFPGGSSSSMAEQVSGYSIIEDDLIRAVEALGYDYFDWNVYSGDGNSSLPAETLVENVMAQVERSSGDIVVLLHDGINNQATVEALPEILDFLKDSGYQFATLYKGAIEVKHR